MSKGALEVRECISLFEDLCLLDQTNQMFVLDLLPKSAFFDYLVFPFYRLIMASDATLYQHSKHFASGIYPHSAQFLHQFIGCMPCVIGMDECMTHISADFGLCILGSHFG